MNGRLPGKTPPCDRLPPRSHSWSANYTPQLFEVIMLVQEAQRNRELVAGLPITKSTAPILRVSVVKLSNTCVPAVSQPSSTSQSFVLKVCANTEYVAAGPQMIMSGSADPNWFQFNTTIPDAPPNPSHCNPVSCARRRVNVTRLCRLFAPSMSSLLTIQREVRNTGSVYTASNVSKLLPIVVNRHRLVSRRRPAIPQRFPRRSPHDWVLRAPSLHTYCRRIRIHRPRSA